MNQITDREMLLIVLSELQNDMFMATKQIDDVNVFRGMLIALGMVEKYLNTFEGTPLDYCPEEVDDYIAV